MAKGKERSKSKEAFRRKRVRGHVPSGLSIRAFCRKHAVRESAFYFWRRELAERAAAQAASAALVAEELLANFKPSAS
jgi:transposase-like protein